MATRIELPVSLQERIKALGDKARRPWKSHLIVLLEAKVAEEEAGANGA